MTIVRLKIFASIILGCLTLLLSCTESKEYISTVDSRHLNNIDGFLKIDLSIKKNKLQKIDSIRRTALSLNDFSKTKKWFKAEVAHKGEVIKAKVRLKGDLQDHYDTDRFSLRLKFKQNKKRVVVSLQHPKTRKYISEWIFHQILKQEKMNYLNYQFVTVSINNKVKGLYACEEHLTNYKVVKKWNKPNGPILSFDDSGFWAGGLDSVERNFQYDTEAYKNAKIRVYNFNEEDSLSLIAINALDAYRNGNLPADSVFNMEMMGKFYALCDLSGATHALRWLNCRYYYHPQTKLLEPVGFDSNSGKLKKLIYFDNYLNSAHHEGLKTSQKFIAYYKQSLKHYKKKVFLDQFFIKHQVALSFYINEIMKTDKMNYRETLMNYYLNQRKMKM